MFLDKCFDSVLWHSAVGQVEGRKLKSLWGAWSSPALQRLGGFGAFGKSSCSVGHVLWTRKWFSSASCEQPEASFILSPGLCSPCTCQEIASYMKLNILAPVYSVLSYLCFSPATSPSNLDFQEKL